jgi:hypothetical protein
MSRITSSLAVVLAVLMAAGCGGKDATGPMNDRTATAPPTIAASLAESFPRTGALQVTKNCKDYTRLAGSYCTITSSNLEEIEVGSTITYATALVAGLLDADVILDVPGPGNNAAFGHCTVSFPAPPTPPSGVCTFSGGTGKFTWFQATVDVAALGNRNFAWDGSYSFSPTPGPR